MTDSNASPVFKTRAMQEVEARFKASIADVLAHCYIEQGMSQAETAAALGVSRESVVEWMALFGIPARDRRKAAVA